MTGEIGTLDEAFANVSAKLVVLQAASDYVKLVS